MCPQPQRVAGVGRNRPVLTGSRRTADSPPVTGLSNRFSSHSSSTRLAPDTTAIQGCVRAAAAPYVASHAFVLGLNDTFLVTTVLTGVCTVLALFVGRDPAIEAAKRAAARGEAVSGRPAIMGE